MLVVGFQPNTKRLPGWRSHLVVSLQWDFGSMTGSESLWLDRAGRSFERTPATAEDKRPPRPAPGSAALLRKCRKKHHRNYSQKRHERRKQTHKRLTLQAILCHVPRNGSQVPAPATLGCFTLPPRQRSRSRQPQTIVRCRPHAF